MKLALLFLTGWLLALTPDSRSIHAQNLKPVPGLGSFLAASRIAVDDSLTPRHVTEISVDDSDLLKKPAIAGALSMLLPGLGQFHNEEIVKGAFMMAGFLGGIAVCIAADIGDTNESISTMGWIGVGMIETSYLWGAIDAPISAHRINQERSNRPTQSLLQIRAGACSISLTMASMPNGMSACIRLGL